MLDVKKWMAKVMDAINPSNIFVTELYNPWGSDVSLTTSSRYKEGTYTVTKAGYYPVCLAGFYMEWISGSNIYVNVYRYRIDARSVGSATLSLGVANLGTTTVRFNPMFYVLWVKVGG